MAESEEFADRDIDLIWGVASIAKVIHRTPRQAFHLCSKGALPSAKKVQGRWVADRQALQRFFQGAAA